ncbi:coiled-coil protein [Legionella lansingensis]|uniref:Coiled-coil protein n=1 Tax=Legionella lansingensis TaxID=45067 RepID=A0A0W0VR96_9GAMM|nr:hypothetical protein [Legionella lansingensis]KTD22656.1 coiled-coil protein [Legionella lansingensis]SNV55849.1 coiled-coil protein [Legionella lansingensis]
MGEDTKKSFQSQESGLASDEEEDLSARELFLTRLQCLQETVNFSSPALSEKAVIILLLKRLPLITGFLNSIDGMGGALSRLAIIQGYAVRTAEIAGRGFQWGGLALAFIDFFRIPLIYLAAVLLGQEPPISLAKNARWLYATVSLALAIIPLIVPITLPPIAMLTAIISLSVSIFLLARHLIRYRQIKRRSEDIILEIKAKNEEIQDIQQWAAMMQFKLEDNSEELNLFDIEDRLAQLEHSFFLVKEETQDLYDEQFRLQQKLKKMDVMAVVDRAIAIALSALVVIGLALTLLSPVMGFSLVAVSAAFAGMYIIARIGFPSLQYLTKWLLAKFSNDGELFTEILAIAPQSQHATPELTETAITEKSVSLELESTSMTMLKLFGEDEAVHVLHEQTLSSQKMEHVDSRSQDPNNNLTQCRIKKTETSRHLGLFHEEDDESREGQETKRRFIATTSTCTGV